MRRRMLAVAAGCLAATGALAGTAQAAFEIESFSAGALNHQAGAHSDVTTSFTFTHNPASLPDERLAEIEIDLPRGLIGDPSATPTCTKERFEANQCDPRSQVGEGEVLLAVPQNDPPEVVPVRVFNLVASRREPALLGIHLGVTRVFLRLTVRENGALRATIDDMPYGTPLVGSTLTLWGVPADHNGGGGERRPFMVNPTDCSVEPVTTLRASSYENRNRVITKSVTSQKPENCDAIQFNPTIQAQPGNRTAGGTAPFNVDILVPQNNDPDGLAVAHLKNATVVLPEGVGINPGQARDLAGCSDGAFGKNNTDPAACPPGSKIGTVGITTPLLPEPMPGDIYLGEPKPGDQFRLFVYAYERGTSIKLVGSARPDPKTGQITTVFNDNPPLPFTRFNLRFRGGTKSVLSMPMTCGPKNTYAWFEPDSGKPSVGVSDTFQIYADDSGAPCPEKQPFNPTFVAGATVGQGGADSGLSLTFGRGDQDQLLGRLKMSMPAGMLGRLASFPLCPTQQALANQCSEDSLVGGVTTSVGSGDALLNLPGRVFLTQPWEEGQIAGLAIIVRAVAGPFDFGTVVVRTGIKVNPDTSLSVTSDPLPTILEGVPLRIRQVTVNVDRPGFMFNPTDCSPKVITGSLTSTDGTEVGVSSPFQVSGCGNLPFSPPMTISTTAPGAGNTVGLEVNLGGLPGHANARQVQVVLPSGVGARLDGPIQSQCSETQFATDTCPDASKIGTARADTPILPLPLEGNVYFLDNGKGGGLPKLAVRLKGLVQLDLVADVIVTPGGRISNTFTAVPDVPISNFRLSLDSGSQAVLTAANICGKKLTAERNMIAHNGMATNDRVPVTVNGCSAKASAKSKSKRTARKTTR